MRAPEKGNLIKLEVLQRFVKRVLQCDNCKGTLSLYVIEKRNENVLSASVPLTLYLIYSAQHWSKEGEIVTVE